jgi:hypothetical protein
MFRIASLQPRNEPGRPYHGEMASTQVVNFPSLAALFLNNFDSAISAIKVSSEPLRKDVDLSSCRGRSAVRVALTWSGGATMALTGSVGRSSGLQKQRREDFALLSGQAAARSKE